MDTGSKYRPIASRSPKKDAGYETTPVRVKKTKSRNGCVACKEKRVKCSEAKPACGECRRRNLACVYRTGIVGWKHFHEPRIAFCRQNVERPSTNPPAPKPGIQRPEEPASQVVQRGQEVVENEEDDYHTEPNHQQLADIAILDPSSQAISQVASVCTLLDANMSSTTAEHGSLVLQIEDQNYSTEHLNRFFDLDDDPNDLDDHVWNFDDPWLVARNYNLCTFEPSLTNTHPGDGAPNPAFHIRPHLEIGKSALLTSLFRQKTCLVLSMSDDPARNPWQTLIWPLAKEHSALDHAMAAMTCLQLGATHPDLRMKGQSYAMNCIAQLELSQATNTVNLDVAIASNLALSMGKSWQHPRTSIGFDQIKQAGKLLRSVLLSGDVQALPAERKDRLRFLANTWMYMDVIARLDLTGHDDPLDLELEAAFSSLNAGVHMLDPLMGCAITLFPLVGKVADLLRRVWQDNSKQNSPIVVSQAVRLLKDIEKWQPSMPSDYVDEPSSLVLDSVQTAEAYRWASMLLLYQTIPALPRFLSLEAIAEKVLVFLATVLPSSGVTAVQIFPLLVAGSDIVDEELRTWIRERWNLMSNRLITGVVERCLEMTNEIWRRRDAQTQRENQSSAPAVSLVSVGENASGTSFVSPKELDISRHTMPLPHVENSHQRHYSSSTAMGSSTMTQSAFHSAKSSVKDRLSWLKVMHDWDWHVMLG